MTTWMIYNNETISLYTFKGTEEEVKNEINEKMDYHNDWGWTYKELS